MNTTKLRELREAAEKATKGPRKVGTVGPNGCPPVGTENGLLIAMVAHSLNHPTQAVQAKADAELIALLDPATVLELCRLAEIGQSFEEATESAKRDIEKLLGVDMRLPVDPNYNPTFDI